MRSSRRSAIQVLDRAIDVLDRIAQARGITLTALSEEVGYPLSTTKRIVDALIANNFVERDPRTRDLLLGSHMRALGNDPVVRSLAEMARPVLEALAADTGEDVALSVLRGQTAVILDRVYGPHPLKIIEQSDVPVPLNCGFRRMLLAYQPPEWIEEYLRTTKFEHFSPTTITSKRELKRSMSEIRKQGYLVAYSEYLVDAAGISAPIFGARGKLEGVVVVVGPISRFKQTKRVNEIVKLTVDAADQITQRLREGDTILQVGIAEEKSR